MQKIGWRKLRAGLFGVLWAVHLLSYTSANAESKFSTYCQSPGNTADDWRSLGFTLPSELTARCISEGYEVEIEEWDLSDGIIPVDKDKVKLRIASTDNDFGLTKLPMVLVHPSTRDLYCDRFGNDWVGRKMACPLPRMFSLKDTNIVRFPVLGDDSTLSDAGVPYSLTLGGSVKWLSFTPDRTVFTRSLTFDKISGEAIRLSNLVVFGDLMFKRVKLQWLSIENVIITGRLQLEQAEMGSVHAGSFGGGGFIAFAHGGVELRDIRIKEGWSCRDQAYPLSIVRRTVDGAALMTQCILPDLN